MGVRGLIKMGRIYKKTYKNVVEDFELVSTILGKNMFSVHSFYLPDGTLFDTGQHHLEKLFIKNLDKRNINQIILTHHHEDHTGNTKALLEKYNPLTPKGGREKENFKLYASQKTVPFITQGFGYPINFYQKMLFGVIPTVEEKDITTFEHLEDIHTPLYTFTPIYTPGHATDHYCFLEKNQGWLFSGDIYVGNVKIMRHNENIYEIINSLKILMQYDFDALFCAHNPRPENGKKYLQEKIDYLVNFCEDANFFHQQGYNISQIIKKMGKKEIYWVKFLTGNDVGLDFMVKHAITQKV